MDTVTIAAAQPLEVLCEHLGRGLSRFGADHRIHVELLPQRRANPAIIQCRFQVADAGSRLLCRNALADVLSELVVNELQEELLRRIVGHDVPVDRDRILRRAAILLSQHRSAAVPGPTRKDYVAERLREYLQRHDCLHLDGFVQFRLPEYLEELEDAVAQAVDELTFQEEYQEFVELLRYFVDLQCPRFPPVHVLLEPNGAFRVVGEDGQEIVNEELQALGIDGGPPGLEPDDVLISALVSLSPAYVLLHDPHRSCREETKTILCSVFDRRTRVCPGCRFCRGDDPMD